MAQIKTFTHTVTINPGETFTLPPNATILFTTDGAGLESVCATIPQEDLKCYAIYWVMNEDWEGIAAVGGLSPATANIDAINNAWEDNDDSNSHVYISKLGGMGSVVDNGTNVSISDLGALESAISQSIFSGALYARKYKYTTTFSDMINNSPGSQDSGYHGYYLYFKSVPSIAETFYLEVLATLGNVPNKPRFFANEIDCAEYDVIVSDVTVCGTDLVNGGNTNDPIPD